MFFNGLPEMPIRDIFINNVNITNANKGIALSQVENVSIDNIQVSTKGASLELNRVKDVKINKKIYNNDTFKPLRINL